MNSMRHSFISIVLVHFRFRKFGSKLLRHSFLPYILLRSCSIVSCSTFQLDVIIRERLADWATRTETLWANNFSEKHTYTKYFTNILILVQYKIYVCFSEKLFTHSVLVAQSANLSLRVLVLQMYLLIYTRTVFKELYRCLYLYYLSNIEYLIVHF